MSSTDYVAADFTWLLARRATAGATPEVVRWIREQGWQAWLNDQLAPARIDDSAFEAIRGRFPWHGQQIWWLNQQLRERGLDGYQVRLAVQCEHVARLLWSRRQLHALMTDFWANHFNVPTQNVDELEASRTSYQNLIQRFALGRFADLLSGISRQPAMLIYLNNRASTLEHPNENQGRELLELHSLGVGNYNETDVLNATRVLTGLSICQESGRYEFKPWYHWVGPVKVVDWTHANDSPDTGYSAAAALFDHLARHQATARRVCTKLVQYFVSEAPAPSLVDRLINIYRSNDTAITPVLRELFSSPEFAASAGQLTRRPMESLTATVRTLGITIDGGSTGADSYQGVKDLVYLMGDAGQSPLDCPTPDGYSLLAQDWTSTSSLVKRWNATRALADDWPKTLTRAGTLLQRVHPTTLPSTHGAFVDNLCLRFFGRTMAPDDRGALLTFMSVAATTPLLATSPAITWQLSDIVAALLDSPYHIYR